MYPATQPKPNPSASNPLPPPSHKPISYATAPATPYSHLQTHDVRPHMPHVRNPQWSAQPYQPSPIHHNLSTQPQHPPSLPHPAAKPPSQPQQIPQLNPSPPPQPPPPPPPPHHYPHAINVVAPHSRQLPPPHQYMYLHPQVVAPVAHVPIGAAHYAHLPPSIWSPSHTQFHPPPTAQHHQRSIHTGPQAPHHISVHASAHSPSLQLHHVHQPHHAQHVYPHTLSTPPVPHHELHPQPVYQAHPVTYQYPHLQSATPSQLAKGTLALPQGTLNYQDSAHVASAYSPKISGPEASGSKHDTLPTHAAIKTEASKQDPHYRSEDLATQGAANRTLPAERIGVEPLEKPQNGRSPFKDDSEKRMPSKEQITSGSPRQRGQLLAGQTPRKPRKPYTITKSREVWTPEEHARFVQALQLYDRDWKKIEAYIGTKTVLQIRSHAQKHFGKVTKYQTGEYIPPPRPKKRAVLPYPRSRSSTATKVTNNSGTGSDSGGGSDNGTISNGVMKNGLSTNGNSSATMSGLHSSSPGAGQGTNVPNSTTIRSGSRPQAHLQRSREGLKATGEKPRLMEGANHPYYDCAAGRSYQDRSLQRVRTLPPPNVLEVSHGASLPHWNSLQSVSGNSSQRHARNGLCSSTSAATHERNRPDYRRHDVQEKDTHMACRKGNSNKVSTPNISDREFPGRSINSEPVVTSNEDRKAVRTAESGQAEAVRAEDGGRVPGPNNSLLVLSNCVDMMARDTASATPAAGWTTTAAARRAHRANVIRGRKPPLQPLGRYPDGDIVYENRDARDRAESHEGVKDKSTGEIHEAARATGNLSPASDRHENTITHHPQTATPRERGRSPPAVQNGAIRDGNHDPQRSSAGSGSNSDDAIAGFSSSDRPSGLSSGGSGSGGSIESSDGGEEDPKSSNDGSGDDTIRQQSPSTRDSSPADPNSSGSRENTPNGIGEGNQTICDEGKVQVVGGVQDTTGGDRRASSGDRLSEKPCDTSNKDLMSGCRANSIANLCSSVPRVADKMRSEAVVANGKKRPRSPETGDVGGRMEGASEEEEVQERAKRKCHSINGILHMTSVEVCKPGGEGRDKQVPGEGSAG